MRHIPPNQPPPTPEQLAAENKVLRRLLWEAHPCGFGAKYGDDGEMTCNACLVDFKRDPVDYIERTAIERTARMWAALPDEERERILKSLNRAKTEDPRGGGQ